MTFEPLSTSELAGLIAVAVVSLLSTLALGFVVLRTIRLATLVFLRPNDCTCRPPEILFFRTQLGNHTACLILSNLFVSGAGVINFSWVSRSGLSQGFTCSAQVVLRQIGIWGTCWFAATLGVHILVPSLLHIRPPHWLSLVASIIGWSISLVVALVPLNRSGVYGPTGLSCGVTRHHPEVFALEALPIILAVPVSFAVYSAIIFVLRLRSNGIQNEGSNPNQRQEERSAEYQGYIRTVTWIIFWFLFAFVLLLLPFCVTRMSVAFAGQEIPSALDILADVCVSMLGFVNACLLYITLRDIGPAHNRRSAELVVGVTKTFDSDASSESIVSPFFLQSPPIWLDEENPQTYNLPLLALNHSQDNTWASLDLNIEKERPKFQTKLAFQSLSSIAPPPKAIGQRQLSVDVPLWSTSRDPRVSVVIKDTRLEPLTRDQECQWIADSDVSRKGRDLPHRFKPLAPLPSIPPLSVRKATDRSSTLSARPVTPAADAYVPSHTSITRSIRKPDQEDEDVPVILITGPSRNEVCSRVTGNADESKSLPSSLSHSGDLTHIRNAQSFFPDLSDEDSRTGSRRLTMTTVWSQETGYTLNPPDTAALGMYPQAMANLLSSGAMDITEVPEEVVIKPSRSRRPKTHRGKLRAKSNGITIVFTRDDNAF